MVRCRIRAVVHGGRVVRTVVHGVGDVRRVHGVGVGRVIATEAAGQGGQHHQGDQGHCVCFLLGEHGVASTTSINAPHIQAPTAFYMKHYISI